MKYYKIHVDLGHMGCRKELPALIYIKAKNILTAMANAKHIPAIKHSKLPRKIIEITEEEFIAGIENKDYYDKMDQIFND